MRVLYYSRPFFADCDFPLIKEMQERGIDIRYYMPIEYGFKHSSILELEKPIYKWGIIKASKIKGMEKYKDCLDLSRLYFVCGNNSKWNPCSWILWMLVYFHILFYNPDVFHITWQLSGFEKIFFYLPFISKKIMTVHDPLQHSGAINAKQQEEARKETFKWIDNFILLNSQQVDKFATKYNIPKNNILVSRLGVYDSIKYLSFTNEVLSKPYILFFGQILPYKGIEYLLDAMLKVNNECNNVDLLIAGGGSIYFDISKYADKDFIKIENRYIGISELVGLVSNSLFVVCPYKDATQSGVVQTAFALDVPIVATRVGALPDMVRDDIYGKIVPPCDSEALASVMTCLIKNKAKLDMYKQNIRTMWYPSMSWSPIVNDYITVYTLR